VIKAALPMVVYFRPKVCKRKPTPKKRPRREPFRRLILVIFIMCLPKKRKHNSNAILKRAMRKSEGEMYWIPI